MATLVENATRVTNALADIKQAIIDKGQTPSGKCETFADAIANIDSGGKCAVGTFTSPTGGATNRIKVTLGFKPKQLLIFRMTNANFNAYQGASPIMYDSEINENQFYRYTFSSASVGATNLGTNTTIVPYSIDDDGFTFNGYSSALYWKYYAIG